MSGSKSRLSVIRLPGKSTLIIRQEGSKGFFVSSDDVIVIEIPALMFLIKFLIQNEFINKKALEGILSEITE